MTAATQGQAALQYEIDRIREARGVPERTPSDRFENAIREFGVVAACEWFGHRADSDFTKESIQVLADRAYLAKVFGSAA